MTKQALGKGVEALFSQPPQGGPGQGVADVAVKEIVPNRYQPRTTFDEEGLKELTETVKAKGILQPITVRRRPQGGYELVAGERRWRAARAAGLQTIPAMIREVSDSEQLEYALIENLQRKDLNGIEAARAYQRLIREFNLTQADVADRVGKERATVANMLRLLSLPREIQEDIERERITVGHAKVILAVPTPEGQIQLWKRIVEEGLTVRDTESEAPVRKPVVRRRRLPPEIQEAESRLQHHLGTRVRIRVRPKGRGQIAIEYYSAEELDRLLDLILKAGG